MSRQEDFKRMAHSHDTESSKYEQQFYIDGAEDGYEYAVEKELPSKRKDPLVISDKVLICTTGGDCLSAEYDYQDKEWIDVYNIETLESNKVTHWMPIVPPRKKE